MAIYDLAGNELHDAPSFIDEIDLDYEFDSDANSNYTVIRVYKNKIDGTKQYPFVYAPNGAGAGTQSTYDMNASKGFALAINAGLFDVSTRIPHGVLIQNGVVLKNEVPVLTNNRHPKPLTIDTNGDLSYAAYDADAETLVRNGIVSAVVGWTPIIIDYEKVSDEDLIDTSGTLGNNAQRQIIGQFGNGDYAIITCEGRNYDHSDGWTYAEAQGVCQKLGLKFAYNLDGGGSTETVLGMKHLNTIYENATGRVVPTYIVFNGSDHFFVPSNN